MAEVFDLTGQKFDGKVKVTLRPGFGITYPAGVHCEGGPHYLPVDIATELLHSNRAFLSDEKPKRGKTEDVEEREPEVEHREPARRKK